MPEQTRIVIRMSEADKRTLSFLASQEDRSVTSYVRSLIRDARVKFIKENSATGSVHIDEDGNIIEQ